MDRQLRTTTRRPPAVPRTGPGDRLSAGVGRAILIAVLGVAIAAGPAQARAADFPPKIPHVAHQTFAMSWKGRGYRIFVSAPVGPAPASGYPILYVTDGNGMFETAAQAAYNQALYKDVTGVDQAIVVAIGYNSDLPFDPRRAYDLSPPDPTAPADTPVMLNEKVAGVGGADAFLDFIETSLKPTLDRRYHIDHRRQALFGHSRGGLFVLHALFTRPAAFQAYIAASPAIWWHDHFVVREEQAFLASLERRPVDTRILITAGGDETGKTMVKDAVAMAHTLSGHEDRGLRASLQVFEGENHISVIPAALSRAVRFALTAPDVPQPK